MRSFFLTKKVISFNTLVTLVFLVKCGVHRSFSAIFLELDLCNLCKRFVQLMFKLSKQKNRSKAAFKYLYNIFKIYLPMTSVIGFPIVPLGN